MRRLLVIAALLFFAGLNVAHAVNPDEVLGDPQLEARAREISSELRCMVCQNQSIDTSDADLARDLRLLVRERLQDGDSNEQVIDYVVSRYGEFVLLKPRLSAHTLLLWGAPLLLLLIAGSLVWRFLRRQKGGESVLSHDEEAELDRLLSEKADH